MRSGIGAILGCAVLASVLGGCGGGGGGEGGNEGVIEFNSGSYSVNENGVPITVITLTRAGGAAAVSVTVTFTDGTATSPADYDSTSQVVSWAAGDTSDKTIAMPIVNDHIDEPDEFLTMHLGATTGGAVTGPQSTATLTILDDDVAGQVEFENPNALRFEDGIGSMIRLIRSGGTDGDVSVTVTSADITANSDPGSFVEPVDYAAVNMTFTFPDGDATPIVVSLSIVQDLLPEIDETFTLNLNNPTNGLTLGTNTTTTVLLIDDDFMLELDGPALVQQHFGASLVKAGPLLLVGTPGDFGAGSMIIQQVDFPIPPVTHLIGPAFATNFGRAGSFSPPNTLAIGGANVLRVSNFDPFNPGAGTIRFDESEPDGGYGSTVLTNGSRVFVGAPQAVNVLPDGRLFSYDALTGAPAAPIDGVGGSNLAASLALSGNTLLAGAPGTDQVRAFDANTLAPLFTVPGPFPQAFLTRFGASVALLAGGVLGPAIVVGAPDTDTLAQDDGVVYVMDGGFDPPLVILPPPPAVPHGRFGANVLVTSTGRICVQQAGGGLFGCGRVFVFDSSGAFVQSIDCPIPSTNAGFGSSMVEFDGAIAIGAPRAPDVIESGRVFIFHLP